MGEVREPDEDQVARWEKAACLYKEKKSLRKVAAAMNVSPSAVRGYLANAMVDVERLGRAKRKDVHDEEIVEMRGAGWSYREIAAQVGLSKSAVEYRVQVATQGHRTGRSAPEYLKQESA